MYCTVDEVQNSLKSLDVSKASGPDKVSVRMLKETASSIAPSITNLFNCSIRFGKLPIQWKTSMIVPIPKSTNFANPENYRPISLICILCKLLERHMYIMMEDHLLESSIHLSTTQWGFRSRRSTVTVLLSITQDWHTALERGQDICAIFFDYRKAFDSVPHLPLIAKLEALQFNEVILRWLSDYLTNRKQYVVVNGAESQPTPVLSGVPQGSILGPLFFLIYIDSLSSIGVSERSCIHLFADDVLLYHPINFTNDFLTVQEDTSKVTEWSKLNHLTLNSAKCKFMIISRKKDPPRPLVPLHLEGESLELVNSIKYLGIHISHDLSWSDHVQHVSTKARKIIGLLYRKYYNFTSPATLLQLYKSLVRPHLEYASAIWSPYLQKDKILLEKVQKFALRMVTKHWDFNYDALLDVVSIDSLESRREEACLCLLYKIINNICYFDSDVFTFSNTRSYHSHSLTLCVPFSRTNSYMYSFVPNTINTWNRLDLFIVSAPSLPSFKFRLLHS